MRMIRALAVSVLFILACSALAGICKSPALAQDDPGCTNGDCPPDPGCTNGDCPPDPGCTNGDCPPPPDCTNGDCPPPPDCTNGDCPPPPDCTNGDCPPPPLPDYYSGCCCVPQPESQRVCCCKFDNMINCRDSLVLDDGGHQTLADVSINGTKAQPRLCAVLTKAFCSKAGLKICKKKNGKKICEKFCELLNDTVCKVQFCAPDWFPFDQPLPAGTVCDDWWGQINECR